MTCMTGLDHSNTQGAQCLDHCREVTIKMDEIDMEGLEIALNCMVSKNSFKSTQAFLIKWPAEAIKVLWFMWSRDDTEGEYILVLGTDSRR